MHANLHGMFTIENGSARACIDLKSGLLCTLKLRTTTGKLSSILLPPKAETELPTWPTGGAPLCFPFSGRSYQKNAPNTYTLRDKTYSMPLHGFCHLFPWHLKNHQKDKITLCLNANDDTLRFYPFNFGLEVTYQLVTQNSLCISACISHIHSSQEDTPEEPLNMPVYTAFHPFFFMEEFDHAKTQIYIPAQYSHAVNGDGGAEPGQLVIEDAFSYESPQLESAIYSGLLNNNLKFSDGKRSVTVKFFPASAFTTAVTFKPKSADAFCLEPWMTLPNAINNHQEGITFLRKNGRLEQTFEIILS